MAVASSMKQNDDHRLLMQYSRRPSLGIVESAIRIFPLVHSGGLGGTMSLNMVVQLGGVGGWGLQLTPATVASLYVVLPSVKERIVFVHSLMLASFPAHPTLRRWTVLTGRP